MNDLKRLIEFRLCLRRWDGDVWVASGLLLRKRGKNRQEVAFAMNMRRRGFYVPSTAPYRVFRRGTHG